jgi:hypothetical protein
MRRDGQGFHPLDILIDFTQILLKNLQKINESPKKTIEEIAQWFSDPCDHIIRHAINTEKLTYVGGKLAIELTDDKKHFFVRMEAYFQKKDGQWLIKSNHSKEMPLDYLILDSKRELIRLTKIEYELIEPAS